MLTNCRNDFFSQLYELKRIVNSNFFSFNENIQLLLSTVMQSSNLTNDIQIQIKSAIQVSEDVRDSIVHEQIMKSLAFEGMFLKLDSVREPYANTFKWILGEQANNEGDQDSEKEIDSRVDPELRKKVQSQYKSWLTSGEGIFHIAGKPGCGKSTLMKMICKDKRTEDLLNTWAGEKQLVIGKFFFLKNDGKMQKGSLNVKDPKSSLSGLQRTLLRQILSAFPKITAQLFPTHWSNQIQRDWRAPSEIVLTDDEVDNAFKAFLQSQDVMPKLRVCIFADGLDEFDDPDRDLEDLAIILKSWTRPELKLCVSSREANAFDSGFSKEQRIRLQELTEADINIYVRGRIEDGRTESRYSPSDLKSIAGRITSRSQGVFLWVRIVTQNARQGMVDCNSIAQLEEKVDHYPPELDDLFQSLLDSIHPSDWKDTQTLLAIIKTFNVIPLKWFAHFDQYFKDKEFAIKMVDSQEFFDNDGWELLELETTRKLNSRSKGLLEIIGKSQKLIAFTHRTVLEFLIKRGLLNLSDLETGRLDCTHMLGSLCLAIWKTSYPGQNQRWVDRYFISLIVLGIKISRRYDPQIPYNELFTQLERIWKQRQYKYNYPLFNGILHIARVGIDVISSYGNLIGLGRDLFIHNKDQCFLEIASYYGLHATINCYFDLRLDTGSKSDSKGDVRLTLFAAMGALFCRLLNAEGNTDDIDCQNVNKTLKSILHRVSSNQPIDLGPEFLMDHGSVWNVILAHFVLSPSHFDANIMELFLVSGSNPDIHFFIQSSNDSYGRAIWIEDKLSMPEELACVIQTSAVSIDIWANKTSNCVNETLQKFSDLQDSLKKKKLSLRDMTESYWKPNNANALLELIDKCI